MANDSVAVDAATTLLSKIPFCGEAAAYPISVSPANLSTELEMQTSLAGTDNSYHNSDNTDIVVPDKPLPEEKEEKASAPKEPASKAPVKPDVKYPVNWGNKSGADVCITFDDGFDRQSIERALGALEKSNVKSTFFVVGSALEQYSELWKKAVEAGHQVCNHTYSHAALSELSDAQIEREMLKWEKAAIAVLGEEYVLDMKENFSYMRLPGGYGSRNTRVLRKIADLGYLPVGWSVETYSSVIKKMRSSKADTETITGKIYTHVVENSRSGSIILLHFNSYDTTKLQEMLEGIQEKGLAFKNLSREFLYPEESQAKKETIPEAIYIQVNFHK